MIDQCRFPKKLQYPKNRCTLYGSFCFCEGNGKCLYVACILSLSKQKWVVAGCCKSSVQSLPCQRPEKLCGFSFTKESFPREFCPNYLLTIGKRVDASICQRTWFSHFQLIYCLLFLSLICLTVKLLYFLDQKFEFISSLYSNLSNSSPGLSCFFVILFLPLSKTGRLLLFEK